MTLRENYTADWAFAIRNAIEKIVEGNFPQEIHSWPIVVAFNFEPYMWKDQFMFFILRDKPSGIPAGTGIPMQFTEEDTPKDPPSITNIEEWYSYLKGRFSLREQDVAFIIPIHDSKKKVEDDWFLWTQQEKHLWQTQLEATINRQLKFKKGITGSFFHFTVPPGYEFLIDNCVRFFNDHPIYERNVFIMTRFMKNNKLLTDLDTELRDVLKANGLNGVRADDKMYMIDRNLWNNVCVYMLCCSYGIAILEDRVVDEFNPNVAIEYGFMRALNKPTLLLADVGFRNLRADIIGTLRETFDITDIRGTIRQPLEKWIKELSF